MKKAFLQLHIAIFLAGFTGVLGRLITLNEVVLVWYRMMITCLVLWVIFLFKNKKQEVYRKQILQASGIGIIVALHWVTFYAGIKISNISTTLVCLSSMGFFTAILEPLFLSKRFDLVEILLGLLVIAGISIVFHFDPQYKLGIIISLISAFLASVFPILNRKLVQTLPPEITTRWQLSGGLIFITLLMPAYLYFVPVNHLLPSVTDWLWLLILAIVCTVISFSLFMNALQKISAFTVNLSYNLEPIYGIAMAFLIYREDKSVSQGFYYGVTLIIAAVILQSLRLRKISNKKTQAALVDI